MTSFDLENLIFESAHSFSRTPFSNFVGSASPCGFRIYKFSLSTNSSTIGKQNDRLFNSYMGNYLAYNSKNSRVLDFIISALGVFRWIKEVTKAATN